MNRRLLSWCGLGAVLLFLALAAGWVATLPPTQAVAPAPPTAPAETAATLAALKPPKRARPLIAVIGINDATETTDYLMPYGILRRADVADVLALATQPGPVTLYPALKVEPDSTTAQFDAQHPEGADYVIVPAMSRDDDPAALRWIQAQAAKGAVVIGVCVGAKVVAAAGLLDGRRATTHWYSVDDLLDEHAGITHVKDRRFVVDRGVATTTGISASMPMSLTLIEAIAGRDKAAAVARELGVAQWDARHVSAAFRFTRPFALTVIGNTLAFWNREQVGIDVAQGVDEVSLALVADAWSRTYRSRAVTTAAAAGAVETRSGLRILPDQVTSVGKPAAHMLPAIGERPAAQALNDALERIANRYGRGTAEMVAMQLELALPAPGMRSIEREWTW